MHFSSNVEETVALFVIASGSSSISSSNDEESDYDASLLHHRRLQEDSILCRIAHQRLALSAVPTDGEAYQYLAMACLEYSEYLLSLQHQQNEQSAATKCTSKENNHVDDKVGSLFLQTAVDSLQLAARWTPCDARVYNNLGITLTRQSQHYMDTDNASAKYSRRQTIEKTYEHGCRILQASLAAGCDVVSDYNSIHLNYGLYLANQDDFDAALPILERVAAQHLVVPNSDDSDADRGGQQRIVQDAYDLYQFCQSMIQQRRR
jgi:hypothetical protein